MADFESLNRLRSHTLRQIREMVSEEAQGETGHFNEQNPSELMAHLERSRARLRALWEQHEKVRQPGVSSFRGARRGAARCRRQPARKADRGSPLSGVAQIHRRHSPLQCVPGGWQGAYGSGPTGIIE